MTTRGERGRASSALPLRKAVVLALAVLAGAGIAAALGGWLFVWSGVYDIGATVQHTQPVYSLLKVAGRQSIRRQARAIVEPRLDDAGVAGRGAVCYREHCLVCHGGPGVAQGGIGQSMQPLPGPLVDAANEFRARELYWVVRHGIKMSGMPAWEFRMADADHWATVAFLQKMPRLDAAGFRAAIAGRPGEACASAVDSGSDTADAARGKVALTQYACNACHLIPGVTGAQIHVGPPLEGLARRALIAGRLANTPEQVAAWIVDPQRFDPATAMPRLGVGEREARDMAAYLATLH